MNALLDPTLDVVFKLLLTSAPESNEVLIALLTAILKPKVPIDVVDVLNPEVPKQAVSDKGIALDLRMRLVDGTQIDLEMQTYRQPAFRKRALYYWARMFG
ncbi:MAG: Rpn family recombination-promoting nuclease/putative transposase, partial [Deltaproteobacteria bacterium]|nr:Rpn family recombination-promoting nuclease/putative transposase [Deltaproteobacteria bacterium]